MFVYLSHFPLSPLGTHAFTRRTRSRQLKLLTQTKHGGGCAQRGRRGGERRGRSQSHLLCQLRLLCATARPACFPAPCCSGWGTPIRDQTPAPGERAGDEGGRRERARWTRARDRSGWSSGSVRAGQVKTRARAQAAQVGGGPRLGEASERGGQRLGAVRARRPRHCHCHHHHYGDQNSLQRRDKHCL